MSPKSLLSQGPWFGPAPLEFTCSGEAVPSPRGWSAGSFGHKSHYNSVKHDYYFCGM